MKRAQTEAPVLRQEEIAPGIFSLWIQTPLATGARPGQFVGIVPREEATLLPRPISVCDAGEDALRLVYRVAGKGTAAFSRLREGDGIRIIGMLGNGFPLEKAGGRRVALIGGGIGIPPLLFAARELARLREAKEVTAVLGYRDGKAFLSEEMEGCGRVLIATENGEKGAKGTVLDALSAEKRPPDMIFACGPRPMLRALSAYAHAQGAEAFLSLEERMACGIGACLACVVKTVETDAHSHVRNARVCTEGPVFEAGEVEI